MRGDVACEVTLWFPGGMRARYRGIVTQISGTNIYPPEPLELIDHKRYISRLTKKTVSLHMNLQAWKKGRDGRPVL